MALDSNLSPRPLDPRPVLVIGATGRIGRRVIDVLLLTKASVRALSRQTTASLPSAVEVIAGDLTAPASLEAALRDVSAVFLLWTAPLTTAAAVIDRIAAAAPSRVVYPSAPHQTPHPFFQQANGMRAMHIEIERLLAATALPTTILRPGVFASNVRDWWAPQLSAGDVVRWPFAAVETAPIDERDVAAVAAHALLDDRHVGRDYVLTGAESLSHADQLRAIGDALGRNLQYEELSPDAFRQMTAGTWPPSIVEMLLSAWGAAVGLPAYVTSSVKEITGAAPRTFAGWALENTSSFRSLPS
jgi:uncharacterized protein YbjT (DUF2867 family)